MYEGGGRSGGERCEECRRGGRRVGEGCEGCMMEEGGVYEGGGRMVAGW